MRREVVDSRYRRLTSHVDRSCHGTQEVIGQGDSHSSVHTTKAVVVGDLRVGLGHSYRNKIERVEV